MRAARSSAKTGSIRSLGRKLASRRSGAAGRRSRSLFDGVRRSRGRKQQVRAHFLVARGVAARRAMCRTAIFVMFPRLVSCADQITDQKVEGIAGDGEGLILQLAPIPK
jgi:hypothetical protein